MQESCTYGSVRGAPSNGRPYRNQGEGTALFETILIGLRPLHFRGKQRTSPERPGVRARSAPGAIPRTISSAAAKPVSP